MNPEILPTVVVGNEFIMPQRRVRVMAPAVSPAVAVPAAPALEDVNFEFEPVRGRSLSLARRILSLLHRYSLATFAIALLIVASAGIKVGAAYWSAQIRLAETTAKTSTPTLIQPLRGPNMAVANAQLGESLQKITGQPLNLAIGEKTVPVSGDTIKSWLKIVQDKGVTYIHVNQAAVTKSLNEAAAPYIKTPVDQVTVSRADGTSKIIAAGRNGTKLGDIQPIAEQITQNVLSAKGMQFILPVETVAFAAVTPAAFDKMIEVDILTKQMWLYEKGQLKSTYLVSAGAPATPTPVGQYKIYSKLPVQDMRGFNADGTRYFQPRVKWVNYFLTGGYAVHGNYWRPQSWFGAINSSHGCVSLPDVQAKEIYDWAPIGTTVITHT